MLMEFQFFIPKKKGYNVFKPLHQLGFAKDHAGVTVRGKREPYESLGILGSKQQNDPRHMIFFFFKYIYIYLYNNIPGKLTFSNIIK